MPVALSNTPNEVRGEKKRPGRQSAVTAYASASNIERLAGHPQQQAPVFGYWRLGYQTGGVRRAGDDIVHHDQAFGVITQGWQIKVARSALGRRTKSRCDIDSERIGIRFDHALSRGDNAECVRSRGE